MTGVWRWKSAAWIAAVGAAAVFSGCGSRTQENPEAGNSASAGGRKPRIALVMKSLANEFFQNMENGAREHQKQNADKYELITNGIKDEQDVGAQVALVEQMVAQKVDALVIAPADSKALIGACRKALDAGIPVVNIDNRFDAQVLAENDLRIPFVGPDNRKGAARVAEAVAKKLPAESPVAIIEGVPTAFNAVQRKLGFEDAISSAGLRIVASQAGNWETAKANQVATSILTEHPDVKALFCANDSMALGAVAALRSAGKEGQVLVAGFDNISAIQELIRDGRVAATADQHAGELAVFGIEYALDILGGNSVPGDRETPVDLVTADSIAGTAAK